MRMKLEEAKRIVELEFGYSRDMHEEPEKHDEALKVIVEALEKQVAEKPFRASEFTNDYVFDAFICPTCEERVFSHNNHCPDCGQKIDWEASHE